MLMTVEELKQYITTNKSDMVLKAMLQALELTIRRYTNNNFQNRGFRVVADIRSGVFMSESLIPFEVGDTIMVSESVLQSDCLAVVTEVDDFPKRETNGRLQSLPDACICWQKMLYWSQKLFIQQM